MRSFKLSLLIEIVGANQTVSTVKEARKRAEELYTYYPIIETTKTRIAQTCLELEKPEQEIRKIIRKQVDASRLSKMIKDFSLDYSSVESGGKRYTSPLLALFSYWFEVWLNRISLRAHCISLQE